MKHKIWPYFVIGVIVLSVALAFLANSEPRDILEVNLRTHTNLALHIHPNLEIEILGERQTIPVNIGISEKGMRVIHTHDSSGELHIESPSQHLFYLDNFFTIWGQQYSSECIRNRCNDEVYKWSIFVNGVEQDDFENIPLFDNDRIRMVYDKR